MNGGLIVVYKPTYNWGPPFCAKRYIHGLRDFRMSQQTTSNRQAFHFKPSTKPPVFTLGPYPAMQRRTVSTSKKGHLKWERFLCNQMNQWRKIQKMQWRNVIPALFFHQWLPDLLHLQCGAPKIAKLVHIYSN